MAIRGGQPERLRSLGEAAMRALSEGRYEEAERLAAQGLAIVPRSAPLLAARASACVRLRRYDQAERDIALALEIQPNSPPQWLVTLALVRRGQGRLDEALGILQRAHGANPAAQIVVSNLAELLTTLRRPQEAYDILASAIARGADRPGLLAQFGRVCRVLKRPAEAVEPLRAAAARADQPALGRQHILFELGHALDAVGAWDDAFEAFAGANGLERRTFDTARHAALVDRIRETWTRKALGRLPRAPGKGAGLTFVVGMRRSGTTLVEQIIAAHPDAAPGGELPWLRDLATPLDPAAAGAFGLIVDQSRITPPEIDRIGGEYTRLADAERGSARLLTDKMPANHKLLGLAQLALPDARVVWCRRDPLDTCLSCYMQPFNDNSYCADLVTLARYFHDCERLTAHWRGALDLPILELHYERLVADPEGETRRLLDFLGLPFDDACLRFHEVGRAARTASTDQVAQRLYSSSVGRAERYRERLGPLVRELERLGPVE